MSNPRNNNHKFAVCIQSDDADLLTARMIYQVLPDDEAAKSEYVRIIDNDGEDYLYPARYFMFLDLRHEIERALSQAAWPFRATSFSSILPSQTINVIMECQEMIESVLISVERRLIRRVVRRHRATFVSGLFYSREQRRA